MGYSFERAYQNWTEFRKLPGVYEVDFHPSDDDDDYMPYHERMDQAYDRALRALRRATEEGYQYVLYTHGASTSRRGTTTSRSQVRKLMRSPDATRYIDRRRCIQHETVFLAALKPGGQREL